MLKLLFLALSFVILHFEVKAYSNAISSFWELFTHEILENSFEPGSILIAILGVILLFAKKSKNQWIAFGLIVVVLFLFYPSMDMNGVENPF